MRGLLVIIFFFAFGDIAAQTVSGVVREKATGLPLPFANVFVNNTTQGIATDSEGKFSLSGNFPSQIELVASFMGYMTEVKSVSFEGQNQAEVIFELSFNESNLSEIELKAKRDKSWERKFKKFEEVFLAVPDDPFKSQIEILNPWVLEFDKVKSDQGPNYHQASAQEPLKIINSALGYEIEYYLQDFRMMRTGSRFFGQVFYKPLNKSDSKKKSEWENARQANFSSSLRYLNQSILLNTPDSSYFALFRNVPGRLDRRRSNDFIAELNETIIPLKKDSILRRPLGDGNFRIFLRDKIEIHHLDKKWSNDYYSTIFHPISWIQTPEGFYDIDRNGNLLNPTQLILSGYLGRQRVARTLPLDFTPQSDFIADSFQTEVVVKDPAVQLNRLREKVWLTTNKSYFYPGEMAWIGGRMLYQEPVIGDSLSRVVYVDLINSNSEVIQSATFPILQDKISGGLVVPQDLKPGDYALRAYTHWNRNFGELDQFLTPFLVLEPGYWPKVDIPESETYVGEIEVNTSFTLSDSLSYRVMGLSVALIDGFQNPIEGEFILSITDAESVIDVRQANSLEQAMNWLDDPLPKDFESDLSYPIEYGISIQGRFIPDNKRRPLINPITIVRGDLEDYGQVTTDSAGRFWATGLYFKDTAQIAVAAVDSKLRPFGSVELNTFSKPAPSSQFPKIRYQILPVPSTENPLDISGDYILLEEFVKEEVRIKETMADRNYGYGEPTQQVGPEELERLTMPEIWGKLRFRGGKFGNYNFGEKVGSPLIILNGQSLPFLSGLDFHEILDSFEPSQLESIKVYSDNISKSIFGMAGYAGVIMIETKKGFRTLSDPDRKFNSEGFQIFPMAGFTDFTKFPKDPPADQYLKRKPTIYWEPNALSVEGVFKVKVKIPYGVQRLEIRIEGKTIDGEAFYKKIDLSL
ncbi:carboxypeptidase-like regulatory domain-containing protein [Algoriphagus persicinus]|uniref:carboxypeptidase-like regulatory domain-containing protein n=1 Tax=Algoriphagus persicinus TaxID=3108754 RepID=UPI002B3D084B|nr:carboxypeptidase-like regulatory domain-containing protein [Algoriphagus sp. E1-3-M2]MEB2786300.1 carboxypeptidase-like regulatory domain-containing protein [Algoriphagus sp. E1-3-M2]